MTSPNGPSQAALLAALRAALQAQYTVDRVLGQGGMGAVFLGRDITLDRPVAIKVINEDVASNPTLRERFLQEARSVAKLRHPNIVSVYSAGDANGLLHFAMEFVPGESLREVLAREGRITGERAERIIREVALALDHAHAAGLVHRDVKPENILIDKESGRAMLTDFGVSRAFEKDGGLTQTGMILGSPRYMSPEQASGDRAIDGRSDLYSLALVAYEMFTGAPVVQSTTMAGMLVKHLTETPAPLSEKAPDAPAHVAAAIDRGLTKDPDARWQTGHQFAEALAGHVLDSSGGVRVPPRAAKKSRTPLLVAAGLVIAVAVGAWLTLGKRTGGTAYLVTPFEIQGGDQSVAWLREGSVNMLTLTLGQWSDLNVVDYERTLSLLDRAELGDKPRLSLDDAMTMAKLANAGTVVTGQIRSSSDSLFVTAKLYSVASGKAEQTAQAVDVRSADPRAMFDRLAEQLLGFEGKGASTLRLAQTTTTNLEAYRSYLNGVKLLNSWHLYEADTAFARAIALDSTFALAYHKKSLGLGWGDVNTVNNPAHRARELAGRLAPRERLLVEGHYQIVQALAALLAQDTVAARVAFDASIKAYDDLLARNDSLVPEAWHGRADAYHHRRANTSTFPQLKEWTTRSLRGFSKTLEIDSTFHLAYSHLVELYNQAATNSLILISGDSAIMADSATVARLKPEGIQRLRDEARARGLQIARAWTRADDGSTRPFLQLATSYMAANKMDTAIAVLREALSKPRSGSTSALLALLSMSLAAGDTSVGSTLDTVLDQFTPAGLREVPVQQRFASGGEIMAAATFVGSTAQLERAAKLFAVTDTIIPTTRTSMKPIIDLYSLVLRTAMGEPMTPEVKRRVLAEVRAMDQMPGLAGQQLRPQSVSIPYLAFLATRDTAFLPFIKAWSTAGQATPEYDAFAALARGDTAAALTIAKRFTPPDSLALPRTRFGIGGMRALGRAEILAAVGLSRQAAATYEAIKPERILRGGHAEPGYTVWVRSLLARARLWKEVGEREKAIAAYEEFIRRWSKADGIAAKQVSEAKQELGLLRDARK